MRWRERRPSLLYRRVCYYLCAANILLPFSSADGHAPAVGPAASVPLLRERTSSSLCMCANISGYYGKSREKKFGRRISWRTGTASPVPIVLTGPVDEALHLFSCVNGHLDWLLDRPFKRLEHGGLSSWHPIECPTQCWTPPCRGKCPIYGLCVVFGMNHQIVTGRGDSRLSLTGKLLSRYLWSYQCRFFSRRKDKQATN